MQANKKRWKTGIFVLVAALMVLAMPLYVWAQQDSVIPASKTYAFDTPPLTGDKTVLLKANPDRGLRMEVYLDVATGNGLWGSANVDAIEQLRKEVALYETDAPRLVQVYFYLHGYKDKDLDQAAYDKMDAYFEALEELNLKAVLRFAYIWDETRPLQLEPSVAQTISHIRQLKPFIEKWESRIHVLQAGIIGAWGEWDAAARGRLNAQSFEALSN